MFCLRVGTSQHTILRTTIWAVNDPMLPNSGQQSLTQQSTSIGDRFLPVKDGDRPICGSLQHHFGCNFFGTKSYGMDRVGCGEDDKGHNNIQKDKKSLMTYMSKYRRAHCNDLAAYGLHNPHVS